MYSKRYLYYSSYLVVIIGLFVSGYLLFNHYSILAGKPFETDLCSVVFGKGCDAAAFSGVSNFMKIPVGGWGMVYLGILGCYLLMSQLLFKKGNNEIIQLSFWISFVGVFFSLFYVMIMALNPMLFCPFCAVFHILNFTLFFLVKKLSGASFRELFKGLLKALGIVFLAKPVPAHFSKWKWLAFIFPVLLALSVYQWALIEGLNVRIEKLASYDPLVELEKFEAKKVWDIQVSPEDPLFGPEDAPVSLIVFSDFQCSLCEMFASNFKYLIEKNKGKLNIRFKYFPLSSQCNPVTTDDLHPLACKAARAAEAAHRQGKFWEYHDALFEKGIDKNPEVFFEVAQSLILDMDKFKTDFESKSSQEKINADIKEGNRLGLEGTPTVFLNGREVRELSQTNINFLVKYLAH
ncbi:MAG: thioredoxin domain-containing protein [Lutibacter sp.]|nr:thioredoxin domain-containing protein [Lutibacter sp.]